MIRKTLSLTMLMALVGGIYLACNDSSATPTGPTDPPSTTTAPPDPPPIAPRVDAPFSWDTYHGFTAFALGHPGQTEQDVQGLFAEAMSHGWNTARICSETEFWSGDGYPTKPRANTDLDWASQHEIAARILEYRELSKLKS